MRHQTNKVIYQICGMIDAENRHKKAADDKRKKEAENDKVNNAPNRRFKADLISDDEFIGGRIKTIHSEKTALETAGEMNDGKTYGKIYRLACNLEG